MGQVLVNDVPAGRPEDVAYKQNLHWSSVNGSE